MTIYEIIELLMKENNIKNFVQLSKEANIPYTTLRNIFTRKSDIKAPILDKLKVTLNTTFDYLIAEKEIKKEVPQKEQDPYIVF